ncbi:MULTISPECIES: hypothetical protein [Burkholderia cepacia complex]|uniref:hypothetical protein n=1 Tax=Burkholderia cepacia complex TaxID=87882 RepID=UPI0020A12751|nr:MULTISPECIES: hypothetical protein [Burkholderia cepacia complex]MCO8395320.1 hypothetical protein [Burkholderia cenocepacia]MCO8403189.1 hypothetical protein [Burkholderia cenocepacia]MCO8416967.1 hypothetical protein [Burkholderia cenocepacia]MCO8449306.1 hypothetical protein [Burkholderia cenocepacia]MCO8455032.1 hypothetical protein [Burkholderia multivorans]
MTTTNNEPTIKELANMVLYFDLYSHQVKYYEDDARTHEFGSTGIITSGAMPLIHKTITSTDISNSKEFYIERAKYLALENDSQYSHWGWCMSVELTNDVDFAKQLIPLYAGYAHWFSKDVRKDKEVIKLILKHCKPGQWTHGGYNIKVLTKENRLGVAYEIIKEFPEYEQLLGATIKKKIGSMGLVEYVEKKNLQKSLKKNLTKDNKPTMRMKI